MKGSSFSLIQAYIKNENKLLTCDFNVRRKASYKVNLTTQPEWKMKFFL